MSLVVGVPTEIKDDEARIAITPDGVRELNSHGIDVLIQAGAGAGSSLDDDTFRRAGAEIVADAPELWERAELICKVKEPQLSEFAYLRKGQVVFTYLHLAAYPGVADALLEHGVTGIAYETVQLPSGDLPLLAPMSEVAGRMSVQVGAHFLERPHGGRGVLMGGAPGVRPARVVVLGAGNVGWNAAWMAAGLEAEVDLLDKNVDRLRHVDQIQMGRITTLASNRGQVERVITDADLVIGAVLVPGGRAPVVVTEGMVRSMKPGSVVVDIAIDQGGCVETSHETTHSEPTFERHGVLHYAVGNMPGAVPHTSTYALTNVTLPYVVELARLGVAEAVQRDAPLALGVNTARGHVVNTVVAEALGRPPADLESTLIEG
ncbi:MAG TPA: alanine dehydrogenase [Acidimicrobiales bacterium]|jgi:alanine dehydrogenase|nr:alanine dehydrogenase [Acidimicrobiales bacterium]